MPHLRIAGLEGWTTHTSSTGHDAKLLAFSLEENLRNREPGISLIALRASLFSVKTRGVPVKI